MRVLKQLKGSELTHAETGIVLVHSKYGSVFAGRLAAAGMEHSKTLDTYAYHVRSVVVYNLADRWLPIMQSDTVYLLDFPDAD